MTLRNLPITRTAFLLLALAGAACTTGTTVEDAGTSADGGVGDAGHASGSSSAGNGSSHGGSSSSGTGSSTSLASSSVLASSSAAVASSSAAVASSSAAVASSSAALASSSSGPSVPRVLSTSPADMAMGTLPNGIVTATFSEAMAPASITGATFSLTAGGNAVMGVVTYANGSAVFTPSMDLPINTAFVATVTTGAQSVATIPLAANVQWTFTTGASIPTALPVNLGTAGNFAILAKTGISTVPASAITGDIGVSPAAASFITGFALVADATNVFSTATQVTGRVYAADYAPPTPANMTAAVADMEIAFTDATSRAPDVTELGAGNIGGMTLVPGVYKWGTGVLIPTDVTLAGGGSAVWIFQIAQSLTVANAATVHLTGGALPKNVFWQVSGRVDVGTTAHLEGVILSQTAITLGTGASTNGRLLAQTAVDIDSSVVVQPAP